ncbi:putative sugar ABC transporter, ATP-binding protein, partial [Aurantimonas manganoxydans SI85-9A1]
GGTRRLSDVSFHLRERETLGIIGVSGNGQATLAHLVSGLVAPDAGGLSVLGEETSTLSPRDLVRRGVGRIPEDRNTEGAIGELAIWENAILERVRDVPFSKGGFVRQSTARAFAADVIDRFDIRGGSAHSRTRLLSGEVQFLPLVGAPEEKAVLLARALSESAAAKGVRIRPAAEAPSSVRLKGYFSAFNDGSSTTLVYVWDVLDASDRRVRRIQGQESVPGAAADPWAAIGLSTLAAVADRTLQEAAQVATGTG